MNAPQLYALITCAAGLLLLLGWAYVTTDNPRSSRIFLKSVVLFVIPIGVVVALPERLFQSPLSMWLVVLIEESLKATAASTEQRPTDRFLLVALFGIWELVWVKPLWGLGHFAVLEDWSNLQLAGLTAAGVVTVLMHGVTAEIYAFRFTRRLPLALLVSWILHTTFNESVDMLGVSLVASLVQLVLLILLFGALWPKGIKFSATPSSSSS